LKRRATIAQYVTFAFPTIHYFVNPYLEIAQYPVQNAAFARSVSQKTSHNVVHSLSPAVYAPQTNPRNIICPSDSFGRGVSPEAT
jgi:hypothetical protein